MKPRVIAIVGPTASGKSALAIAIAKAMDGEVISADSRQVYRDLDLGTGKVTQKEMMGIPHHLLDVSSPKQVFTVEHYKKKAEKTLKDIVNRGKVPVICGGTGLYVDALLGSVSWPEVPPNPLLRKKLEKKTAAELFALLSEKDPARAKTIDKHNPVRLIRALEIVEALGKVPKQKTGTSPYDVLWIGIFPGKERLEERIALRLQERMRRGLAREVKQLHQEGLSWKRMEGLGLEYRYLSRMIRGIMPRGEALAKLEAEIVRYAKRQITWFKRNPDIQWFDPEKRSDQKKIGKIVQTFLLPKGKENC